MAVFAPASSTELDSFQEIAEPLQGIWKRPTGVDFNW